MGSTVTSLADWALAYAAVGFRVLPLWPGEKRPMYDNWPNDATTDPDLIRRYWQPGSDRNIGVVCGEKFDAWDIEAQYLNDFNRWIEGNGWKLPESPIQKTGRGGWHILTEPTGVAGSRNLYLDGKHIGELKSKGGFIVVSPSVFIDGGGPMRGVYTWLWRSDKLAVNPAPEWLLGLLERPRTGVHKFPSRITDVEEGLRRLEGLSAAVREAGEGRRNQFLYWAMRRALEEGIPPRYAGEELRAVGVQAGLTDHEVRATLWSAYRAEGRA